MVQITCTSKNINLSPDVENLIHGGTWTLKERSFNKEPWKNVNYHEAYSFYLNKTVAIYRWDRICEKRYSIINSGSTERYLNILSDTACYGGWGYFVKSMDRNNMLVYYTEDYGTRLIDVYEKFTRP